MYQPVMSRHETPDDLSLDPRVRRTRKWIGDALADLLQEKPFADISISDITRRAGIARVTFYQHFENKQAVLLALVSEFFEGLYQMFDIAALAPSPEAGALDETEYPEIAQQLDPKQVVLLRVGLEHAGPSMRRLAVIWFAQTLVQAGYAKSETEAQVLATYHVSGMLALLETYLNDELHVSEVELKTTTLALLDALLQQTATKPGASS